MIDIQNKKTPHILKPSSLKSLAKDFLFKKELNENSKVIAKKIYFDTAGVIDMFLGLERLITNEQINWNKYRKEATLVYALGYKNWLGKINLLTPHTEELITLFEQKERIFKEHSYNQTRDLKEEFWKELNFNIYKFDKEKLQKEDIKKLVSTLKVESIDLLKLIYLSSENSFWKNRYKHLIKDKKILDFSIDLDDSMFQDIARNPLFKPLLKYLNERRKRSSNNYIDAVALCLLDEKLMQFEQSDSLVRELPIFFTDQELILKAAQYFSRSLTIGTHRPFTYRGNKGDFLIIRDANFFIIEGVANSMKDSDDLLTDFMAKLEEFIFGNNNSSNSSKKQTFNHIGQAITERTELRVHERSEQKIFLEFFNNWWEKEGYAKLIDIFNNDVLNKNKQKIDAEVLSYVAKERKKLSSYFDSYSGRIALIKKIWYNFQDLDYIIKDKYENKLYKINIYKEFSPKFNYSEVICEQIQVINDRIFNAVKENNSDEMNAALSEVVTDLIIGLFATPEAKGKKEKDRLNHLEKGIAILWTFERFDLIENVCHLINERHLKINGGKDEYPSPTIAIMHASAILLGSNKDENKVEHIINCIEGKFGETNHNVCIGLSYLYFLRWKENVDEYEFPEKHFNSYNKEDFKNYNHLLKKSLNYSLEAIDWLTPRRKKDTKKQKYRQRKYYYALNNYIFTGTILLEAEEFLALKDLVKIMVACSDKMDFWQAARFSDTLARYYYRLAFLSTKKNQFDMYLNTAFRYNFLALKATPKTKEQYNILNLRLQECKNDGFRAAKKTSTKHKAFLKAKNKAA